MTERRAAYRVDYELELARQVHLAGLPEPVRQHRFHPVRKWRFDLAFPAHLLAVEVDGGVWINGRHTTGAGYSKDCEKLNEAVLLGWRVLRFTPAMVSDGSAVQYIEYALQNGSGQKQLTPDGDARQNALEGVY